MKGVVRPGLALLLVATVACDRSRATADAAEAASVAEGSGPIGTMSTPSESTPAAPGQPDPTALDPATADSPPPALTALMRRVGFTDSADAVLADFVHLPPGATGEAGSFGQGDRSVRVALIGYPNSRFAAPHVTDIRERRRVLPNPRECIVSRGRWVAHVVAADLASAESTCSAIAAELGWELPSD